MQSCMYEVPRAGWHAVRVPRSEYAQMSHSSTSDQSEDVPLSHVVAGPKRRDCIDVN